MELRSWFRRLRRRVLLHALLESAGVLLSLLLLSLALLPYLRSLLGVLVGVPVALAVFYFLWRSRGVRSDRRLAALVEAANPWMEERLLSEVELLETARESGAYSPFLLKRLESEVRGLIVREEMTSPLSWNRWVLRGCLAGLLVFLVSLIVNPGGYVRTLYAFRGEMLPAESRVVVWPGSARVFSDSTLKVTARVLGDGDSRPMLHTRNGERAMRKVGELYESELRGFPEERTFYWVKAGRARSEIHEIVAVPRPYVDSLVVRVSYPAYTGLAEEFFLSPAVLSPLEGSRVRFEGKARGADSIEAFLDGDPLTLDRGDESFGFDLLAGEPVAVGFRLWTRGLSTESPQSVLLRPLDDHPPEVTLLEPRGDVTLNDETEIPIGALLEDDFGLRTAELWYEFEGEESRIFLEEFRTGRLYDSLVSSFDLSDLFLLPGEELSFRLRVWDGKGQIGESREVRVRFPTLEEIYEAMDGTGEASVNSAEDIRDKLAALSEKAQQIEDILKEDRELEFGEREELEQLIAQEEELMGELSQMSESLDEVLERLEQAPLLDRQVLQKMQEVGELMEEIMTEEMRRSLEKLRQAMETMKPMDVQSALEELLKNQEEILQNLERFSEMLKRINEENELLRMAETADRLREAQENLKEQTEAAQSPEACENLSSSQDQLNQELEALKDAMEELARELEESDSSVSEELSEMAQEELSEISSSMCRSRTSLSQGKKSDASKSQSQSAKDLESLSESLRSLHASMLAARMAEALSELTGMRRQALFLAERQRDLVSDLDVMAAGAEVDPFDLAVIQDGIRGGVDLILQSAMEMARQSFFIGPRIIGPLAQAARNMLETSGQLGQLSTDNAVGFAHKALVSIDLAVLAMMDAQSKMSCSGSCSGLEQALQALAQMAQKQASLAFGTQSLFPLPSPVPAPVQGQLQRLAGEQDALRKALEGLRAGLSEEGLERTLEQVSREMEEVARELSERRVNADLIDKQRRILSRLLDAQKSIRKREFSRKRISETGREYEAESPPAFGRDEEKKRLRRALLEVRQGEYPTEFRRLIEAYFETLLNAGE
jgi:hypothetical protein